MPPSTGISSTRSAAEIPVCGRAAASLATFTMSGRRRTASASDEVVPRSGQTEGAVGAGIAGTGTVGACVGPPHETVRTARRAIARMWHEDATDVPRALIRGQARACRYLVRREIRGDRVRPADRAPRLVVALVMTAERAGAYKPDPRPYRAALDALRLDPRRVLFVAGSAHDVGGASRVGMDVYWANRGGVRAPTNAKALREEPDLRGLVDVLEVDRS